MLRQPVRHQTTPAWFIWYPPVTTENGMELGVFQHLKPRTYYSEEYNCYHYFLGYCFFSLSCSWVRLYVKVPQKYCLQISWPNCGLNSCKLRPYLFVPSHRFGEHLALSWQFSDTSVMDRKRLTASHLQSDSLRSLQLDAIIAFALVKCLKDPMISSTCKPTSLVKIILDWKLNKYLWFYTTVRWWWWWRQ